MRCSREKAQARAGRCQEKVKRGPLVQGPAEGSPWAAAAGAGTQDRPAQTASLAQWGLEDPHHIFQVVFKVPHGLLQVPLLLLVFPAPRLRDRACLLLWVLRVVETDLLPLYCSPSLGSLR